MRINAFFAFALLLSQQVSFAQNFKFNETEEGVSLSEGSHAIYFYQKETKSLDGKYPRANYLHPLYGLKGEVLTEDFPADHFHHRGIFWAWHQLLVDTVRIGDGWECRGVEWLVTSTDTDSDKESARLFTSVDWKGELKGKEITFIKEQTIITTYPTKKGYREIDFDINLTAQGTDVWLGGSEDHKGYSGFSARVKLPEDLAFSANKGNVTPTDHALNAGGWVDMTGTFGKETSGVTMMADTTLSSPFHGWILRSEKSMQNAAFPGREPIRIPAGKTLHLRYKLVVHKANFSKETIETIYENFKTNR